MAALLNTDSFTVVRTNSVPLEQKFSYQSTVISYKVESTGDNDHIRTLSLGRCLTKYNSVECIVTLKAYIHVHEMKSCNLPWATWVR